MMRLLVKSGIAHKTIKTQKAGGEPGFSLN